MPACQLLLAPSAAAAPRHACARCPAARCAGPVAGARLQRRRPLAHPPPPARLPPTPGAAQPGDSTVSKCQDSVTLDVLLSLMSRYRASRQPHWSMPDICMQAHSTHPYMSMLSICSTAQAAIACSRQAAAQRAARAPGAGCRGGWEGDARRQCRCCWPGCRRAGHPPRSPQTRCCCCAHRWARAGGPTLPRQAPGPQALPAWPGAGRPGRPPRLQ